MEYLSAIFWSDDKDEEDYCLLKSDYRESLKRFILTSQPENVQKWGDF